jgi:hypothetical protein
MLNSLEDDFLCKREAPSTFEELNTHFSSSMSLKNMEDEYFQNETVVDKRKRKSIIQILTENQNDFEK